jgi:hypothetical protein
MPLDDKQKSKIGLEIRKARLSGDPMRAMRIQAALDAGELPDSSLMGESGGVKTDRPVKGNVDLTPPPRTGKGSGVANWRKFAAKVTDVDAEVLSRMNKRDDIIDMLVAKGNLPSE